MKWLILICCLATPLAAEVCPPVPDHRAEIDRLLAKLKASRGNAEARKLNDRLWELWTDAPDVAAQRMLDVGMQQRTRSDFAGSRATLDDLVAYCPDFAEGYNQRAFSSYLQQDFSAALVDLDRALELMPDHIGAMSGRGLTLMGLGRHDEAQEQLRAAVRLNPWLSERSLLTEPIGIDI